MRQGQPPGRIPDSDAGTIVAVRSCHGMFSRSWLQLVTEGAPADSAGAPLHLNHLPAATPYLCRDIRCAMTIAIPGVRQDRIALLLGHATPYSESFVATE